MKYNLIDIVPDTFSNTSGLQLYLLLEKHIKGNTLAIISFKDSHALSSSFLNSSFGELISKYGFEVFKKNIKAVDLSKSQAEIIRYYLKSCGIEIK